jgi:hypothetical protein
MALKDGQGAQQKPGYDAAGIRAGAKMIDFLIFQSTNRVRGFLWVEHPLEGYFRRSRHRREHGWEGWKAGSVTIFFKGAWNFCRERNTTGGSNKSEDRKKQLDTL